MWRISLKTGSYVKDPIVNVICEGSHCEAHTWRICLSAGSYVRLICEGSYCEVHMSRISLKTGSYVKDFIEDKISPSTCHRFCFLAPRTTPRSLRHSPPLLLALPPFPTSSCHTPSQFYSFDLIVEVFDLIIVSFHWVGATALTVYRWVGIRSWQSVAILAQPCKHTNWSVSLCTAHS